MSNLTKQKTFDFYFDQKVTTWYRTEYTIKADSEEEAKQKAIEFMKRGDHIVFRGITWMIVLSV